MAFVSPTELFDSLREQADIGKVYLSLGGCCSIEGTEDALSDFHDRRQIADQLVVEAYWSCRFAVEMHNVRFQMIRGGPARLGQPQLTTITKTHPFWPLVPFGKVTKPTIVRLTDLNGEQNEFIGEALDTTYNILIFACPMALFKS